MDVFAAQIWQPIAEIEKMIGHENVIDIIKTTVANVKKLFMTVIYKCNEWARVFVSGKLFQLSLMFACKPGVYRKELPSRVYALGLTHKY
jgi:hypothetical protein